MYRILILGIVLLFLSCGTIKQTEFTAKSSEEKHFLPPNTASNKYSKMRQRN